MYLNNIIHCDKCNSTDVLHEHIVEDPPEVSKNKTMSEVIADSSSAGWSNAVYIYEQYRIVCNSCGYTVMYQV